MADQNTQRRENRDPDVIHRMDGKGVILKVRQALDIDKVRFSFVSYGSDNKATSSVDCYLSAEDFGLLMERARNESLQKQIYKEKQRAQAEGEQYPKAIYTSPIGGGTTKHSGVVSRHFTIAPGSRAEVMFTGLAFAAERSSTGAYIAKKGEKPVARISVPATYHDLALMAYKWQWLEKDYMPKRFNMVAMKSDYNREEHETDAPVQQQEEPSDGFADIQDTEDDLPFA